MLSINRKIAASALIAAGLLSQGMGQLLRPALEAKAIVGARIQVAPGRVIEKGTVLIRDGLIAAVGPDVTVPAGAEVVDGTGLTVYAGFIDAGSTKGLKIPTETPRQEALSNRNFEVPTTFRSTWPGAHAGWMAADLFQPDDAGWGAHRSAGFTTVLLFPDPGVFRGTAALINLNGKGRRESVILNQFAVALRLQGVDNVYPDSQMGAFAVVRQSLLDTQWRQRMRESFAQGGAIRPPDDPNDAVLAGLLAKQIPLLIEADQLGRIDRSLVLAAEFGIRPILYGGLNAHKAIDQIKAASAPVILALNFGQEPKAPEKPKEPDPGDDPVDEPADRVSERVRVFREHVANAGLLERAGIPFALSTRGVRDNAEFMANLRRAVDAGLSRDGALAALTVNAARIFGLERQLGTIEAGKIANLTVMSGDFLDARTRVRLVFVDGAKMDPSRAASTPRPAGPSQEDHEE